jgi:hypothetical protein
MSNTVRTTVTLSKPVFDGLNGYAESHNTNLGGAVESLVRMRVEHLIEEKVSNVELDEGRCKSLKDFNNRVNNIIGYFIQHPIIQQQKDEELVLTDEELRAPSSIRGI